MQQRSPLPVPAAHIPFIKMNGLGNDFVVIDARASAYPGFAREAMALADRKTGVGCDQAIVLEPSARADVYMRVFNADGSEAGACGNATRCIALLLREQTTPLTVETGGGILTAEVREDGMVTVDMGSPSFAWDEIPLAHPVENTLALDLACDFKDGRSLAHPSAVSVGNPHCIFWATGVDAYDLAEAGPLLECHPLFPERANISFAEVLDGGTIELRVWERGAGLTQACGTAACAVAAAAVRTGRTGRHVAVRLPGGVLRIEVRAGDGHILMTGPAAFEFQGTLRLGEEGRFLGFDRTDPQ